MSSKITYIAPAYISGSYRIANSPEVLAFVGPVPSCPICGGSGEYEDDYGSQTCLICYSRLVQFINFEGKRAFADWGDTIERKEDGLHLIKGDEEDG